MAYGVIKAWNQEKGYGFIRSMDSEFFVHISALPEGMKGPIYPAAGDRVEFDVKDSGRKLLEAVNVRYVYV